MSPIVSSVAASGADASLDEVYRRHSADAWRLAFSITRNRDDASDAVAEAFAGVLKALARDGQHGVTDVRGYLMAATRNAAIDLVRRAGRVVPSEEAGLDQASASAGPSERLQAEEDRDHVAQALAGLPPRWRAVLWLTEVEGMAARDVARLLTLSPNNAAQLATRARARLRQLYIQSHVRNHASGDCAWVVDHLGGLATGTLTAARAERVRRHLAGCSDCRRRLAELDDLGLSLRRAAFPLALALRRSRHSRWLGRLTGWVGRSRQPGPEVARPFVSAPGVPVAGLAESPLVQGAVAAVAAGLLAIGVTSLVLRQDAAAPAAPRTVEAAPVAGGRPEPGTTLPEDLEPTTTTTAVPTTVAAAPAASAPTAFTPRGPLAAAQVSTVATATVSAVSVYDVPGGVTRRSLASPQQFGSPLVLLVTEQRGDWLQVLLPVRPNGSTGWVRSDQVSLSTHTYRIVVELGAHRITAYSGVDVILSEPIAVGTADTPTPGGLYYVMELVKPADASGRYYPGGPYGPFAYTLSGYSDVLFDFAGGDGQFGIHGTNDPAALGTDVSHGCIRMSNAGVSRLAGILPLGVPVEILG